MLKKQKFIGIKELQHTLSHVTKEVSAGKSFVVLKHARPVFRIEPIPKRERKTYGLKDLYDIRFTSKDRNLSKNIDRLLYS